MVCRIKTLVRFGVTVALVLSVWLAQAGVHGQELVQRSFLVFMPPGTEPIDFTGPDSIALITAGQTDQYEEVRFASVGQAPELYGTMWGYRPAFHITIQGQKKNFLVYWLITEETPTPPPAGTVTFTGSNSQLVISQQVYSVKPCTSGVCGSANNGQWYVPSSGGSERVVLVKAVFNR